MSQITDHMAARGLRPAAELAATKPHGTRVRYMGGCRCAECRRANSAYETLRAKARAIGEGNHLVSAQRVAAHLVQLGVLGVGYKTAADAAQVSPSVVRLVLDGKRLNIRAQTEKRLLAVTSAAAADRACIAGAEAWKLLDALLASGYTKRRLASEIAGRPMNGLQLKRGLMTVRNADQVRKTYERPHYAAPATQRIAAQQLQELRDEGYRPDQILRRMTELALRRGWPAPTLGQDPKGRPSNQLKQREAELLHQVHTALLAEDSESEMFEPARRAP